MERWGCGHTKAACETLGPRGEGEVNKARFLLGYARSNVANNKKYADARRMEVRWRGSWESVAPSSAGL